MIQIRYFYGDWKETSRTQAERFVRRLLSNMPAVSTDTERRRIINERHLNGVTVEELIDGKPVRERSKQYD